RRSGWRSGGDLEQAAERSRQVGDEQMADDIRWIRSYVLEEGGGSVGTVCIYQATSPEAIREHASRADLPVDEIIPVADLVIVRPDPQPAGASLDRLTPREARAPRRRRPRPGLALLAITRASGRRRRRGTPP